MGKKKYNRAESMEKFRNHIYSASVRLAELQNDRELPQEVSNDVSDLRLLVLGISGLGRAIEERLNASKA